jgi:hypothetical protein
MVKKLLMRFRLAVDITAALLYVLFLQSLACFPKKQVTIGLFEAAE